VTNLRKKEAFLFPLEGVGKRKAGENKDRSQK